MTDLEFIKRFSRITIKNACLTNGFNSNNLWAGKMKKKRIHLIRKAIEAEIGNLYIEEYRSEIENESSTKKS